MQSSIFPANVARSVAVRESSALAAFTSASFCEPEMADGRFNSRVRCDVSSVLCNAEIYLLQLCETDFIEQGPSSFTKIFSSDYFDLITIVTVNGKKGTAIHINGAECPPVTGSQTGRLTVATSYHV